MYVFLINLSLLFIFSGAAKTPFMHSSSGLSSGLRTIQTGTVKKYICTIIHWSIYNVHYNVQCTCQFTMYTIYQYTCLLTMYTI